MTQKLGAPRRHRAASRRRRRAPPRPRPAAGACSTRPSSSRPKAATTRCRCATSPRRAEVALGTLYRHYSSKDQLLLAALADQAEHAAHAARAAPAARRRARRPRCRRAAARDARADPRPDASPRRWSPRSSSPEPQAASAKDEVYEHAPHDHQRRDRRRTRSATSTASLRVLGYVWLATLSAWVGGHDRRRRAWPTDLATAAHLLLDRAPVRRSGRQVEEREHLLAEDRRRCRGRTSRPGRR